MSRVRKAIGAFLGGVTAAGIVGLFELVGVEVPLALATPLSAILAYIGAYLAPPNDYGVTPTSPYGQ